MRTMFRHWPLGIAAITMIGAMLLFLAPQMRNAGIAGSANIAPPAATHKASTVPQIEIVPAEALAPADPYWVPLTGDGGN